MFNLEQSIANWRRGMTKSGPKSEEFLDELESHLRDDIEDHNRQGLSVEAAFTIAASQLGRPAALKQEFNKTMTMNKRLQKARSILRTPIWEPHLSRAQFKYTILTFAGIPGPYVDNSKQPAPGVEPGWATYLRSALLMGPAILMWFAARTLLLPKLTEILSTTGFETPRVLRQLLTIMEVTCLYWWVIAASGIGLLALFEWRASAWPRFRRATMGVSVFLLNICTLLLLMAIGILALIAASILAAHK